MDMAFKQYFFLQIEWRPNTGGGIFVAKAALSHLSGYHKNVLSWDKKTIFSKKINFCIKKIVHVWKVEICCNTPGPIMLMKMFKQK